MFINELHTHMLYIQWGAVLCASLVAAVCDWRTRRIPNVLTLPLFGAGLLASFTFAGGTGLLESFAASMILAFPFVLLYAFAGGGAGDAKLMAAIGAWLGLASGLITLVSVVFTGAVLGILFALFNKQFGPVMDRLKLMMGGILGIILINKGKGLVGAGASASNVETMLYMPYGLAIFCGSAISALGVLVWQI